MTTSPATRRIVAVNAGVGQPSSTRLLVDRVTSALTSHAGRAQRQGALGLEVSRDHATGQHEIGVEVVELRDLAVDIANASVSGLVSQRLAAAIATVTSADGVVLATPIYKASYSGLFKSFVDVLDNDALLGMPLLLLATGGSPRHALAVDSELRPLAAYLRALVVPTALYASPEDWGTSGARALAARVDRAAGELLTLVRSGAGRDMVAADWGTYQRTLQLDPDGDDEITLDPDLLRAATGGSLL